MIDGISPATIVFPIFNFAFRAIRTGYDVVNVPTETSDYLKTVSQVLSDIRVARELRNERAHFLSTNDLGRVDDAIKGTESAMSHLETLLEPARVDMSNNRRVGAGARIMWVIRDQHKVDAAINRLSMASQSLHGEVIMMRLLALGPNMSPNHSSPQTRHSPPQQNYFASPDYHLQETTRAMNERREWVKRRHSHTSSGSASPSPAYRRTRPRPLEEDNETVIAMSDVVERIRENEAILASLAPDVAAGPRSEFLEAVVVGDQGALVPPRQMRRSRRSGSPPASLPLTPPPLAQREATDRTSSHTIELEGGITLGATSGPLEAFPVYSAQSRPHSASMPQLASTMNHISIPNSQSPAPSLDRRHSAETRPDSRHPQSASNADHYSQTSRRRNGSSSNNIRRSERSTSHDLPTTSSIPTPSSRSVQSFTSLPGQRPGREINIQEPVVEEDSDQDPQPLPARMRTPYSHPPRTTHTQRQQRQHQQQLLETPSQDDPPPSYSLVDSEITTPPGSGSASRSSSITGSSSDLTSSTATTSRSATTRRRPPRVYPLPATMQTEAQREPPVQTAQREPPVQMAQQRSFVDRSPPLPPLPLPAQQYQLPMGGYEGRPSPPIPPMRISSAAAAGAVPRTMSTRNGITYRESRTSWALDQSNNHEAPRGLTSGMR